MYADFNYSALKIRNKKAIHAFEDKNIPFLAFKISHNKRDSRE